LKFVYLFARLWDVPVSPDAPPSRIVSHLSTDDWEQAMVTGNGRQGVLVYGGPATLRLTLSHERLFLPVDEPIDPPETARLLPRLREMAYAGRFQAAADAVVEFAAAEEPGYARLRWPDPFVGAATVCFTVFGPDGRAADWRRSVDLATGVVRQECGALVHEVFVSRVRDVVAARIRAPRLSGRLHLGPIAGAPPVPIQLGVTGGRPVGSAPRAPRSDAPLTMTAEFPTRWPGGVSGYQVACRVATAGGRVEPDLGGASLVVDGARELTLLARTTVFPAASPEWDVDADFDALLAEHEPTHRTLFDRCRLNLSASVRDRARTTEDLLSGPAGPALVERLFDAGRYVIICASGDRPPALQGVWSGTFDPAWRGGYTVDGNLQMAVAALAATGTPELMRPVFDLLDGYRDHMRANAARLYGAPGILVAPHMTTHGRHNHFHPRWCLTFWTAGAAWCARLYYDHWRHTGDARFLAERALPFMREAAAFYTAFADRGPDGAVRFAPSYSPENSPAGDDGPQCCVNATMDVAAVRDLLRNLLDATGALGLDDPRIAGWRDLLDRLPPYRVGADGSLAEWLWPGLPDNHAHRHASHLYGLWYEPDPRLLDDPELREAAATAVRRRLAWWREAGDEMAFGLAQLGLAAAALGLADEAYETVTRLALRYWRPSGVSTHNAGAIFNTDVCGGLPAVVVAMLVRARGERVDLLPARPSAWPAGQIRGVRLRGGLRVDRLTWAPGRVEVDLAHPPDREPVVSGPPGTAVTVNTLRDGR
jgi:alpha-L-fucosidase 2